MSWPYPPQTVQWAFIALFSLPCQGFGAHIFQRCPPSMQFLQMWNILGMCGSWFECCACLHQLSSWFTIYNSRLRNVPVNMSLNSAYLRPVWCFKVKIFFFILSEILQQNACTEVVDIDPQFLKHEMSSLDRHDTEPPQIKDEQEELCVSQNGEQLKMEQEADAFVFFSAYEESEPGAEQFEMTGNHSGRKQQRSGPITDQDPKPSKMHCRSNKKNKSAGSNIKCDPRVKYLGFTSKLQMHLRQNAGEKQHVCEICGKRFAYKSIRDKHARIHAEETPYLSLKLDLNSQASADAAERPHSCPTCGKRFRCARVLKAHLKTHSGEKPFLCKTCGKRFTYRSVLKNHITIHTGEKPYPCNTCGRRFSRLPLLESHLHVHTGEKPFSCKTCGKRFAYRSVLKSHIKIHTGERPYSCDMCGKKFSGSSGLKSHLRIHTGEKPYACDTCGRRFTRSATLKSHLRVHTGEKPFSCQECGKCFTVRCSLMRHMSVHTGEKPYCCQECSKCFTDKNTLMRHMRIHTGEKPYRCETCGKAFRNAGNLNVHLRNHKAEDFVM